MLQRHDFFPASKQAPALYQKILEKYGTNLYGETLLRLIFLPSRCYIVGGWWENEKEFGYRRAPKYAVNEQKWAIEKFCPASKYGNPWTWESQTISPEGFMQVGPFPVHGEYECAAVFSTGRGPEGYVPLEPGTVDLQARLIHLGRTLTLWDIRNNLTSEEESKEHTRDAGFDVLWEEVQHTRKGLTFGRGGKYDPQAEIDAMKNQLLQNKDLWMPQEEFRTGFGQTED